MRVDDPEQVLVFPATGQADAFTERRSPLSDRGVAFRYGRLGWSRARATWALALVVVAIVGWGAQRSQAAVAPNVVAVIKARALVLYGSPFSKQVTATQLYKLATVSRAKAAQPALRNFTEVLIHTVAAVSAASVTQGQQLGKADYVAGNREQVRGLRWYEREMADVLAGRQAAARDAFFRGQVLSNAGNEIANRGDRLLGLPTVY